MWMGGPVPLGYDLEARKLIPHATEAATVRDIFALYLKLGCVRKLMAQLNRENIKTKAWATKAGSRIGGVSFARGHLYYLLRNRLYVGEIRHRERWYTGEHPGIVSRELWDRVQAQLDSNLRTHHKRARDQSSSLLSGLIEDGEGNRFTPSFTIKGGRRYRYYVSPAVIQNPAGQRSRPIRLPAHEIESRVKERLQAFLGSDAEVFNELMQPAESPAVIQQFVVGAKKLSARISTAPADDLRGLLASILQKVVVRENNIEVLVRKSDLRDLMEHGDRIIAASPMGACKSTEPDNIIHLTIEAKRKRFGGEIHLMISPDSSEPVRHPRPALIKAVARSYGWYEKVLGGRVADIKALARETGLTSHYVRNVFACAFLAPDIVEAIVEGRQPLSLKFEHLYKEIPLSWAEQRRQFGFPQDSLLG
jgi:site-specific DNA recombinase